MIDVKGNKNIEDVIFEKIQTWNSFKYKAISIFIFNAKKITLAVHLKTSYLHSFIEIHLVISIYYLKMYNMIIWYTQKF